MSRRLIGVATVLALACCPVAAADLADETALAQRHAPVVRIVEQLEECGHGEPYRPTDVDLLFDEPTVSLRGPWNPVDLVKVGPKAADLAGLFEYHLDFPGNALNPGCGYETLGPAPARGPRAAVYSHVATDPAHPGKLALQYWLFYTFNDWNNLHEGDWEMIQLLFDADDAEEALTEDPVSVGYSQHEGAEAADWGDEKLELVDGRRPVVYPAAGSHANFFDPALYVGSSGEQGVGCDDTRGPHLELEPKVVTIPSESAGAASPWLTFEGRWGELQDAFFNGPTGPNLKTQWTEPVTWSEGWRPRGVRRADQRPLRHRRDRLLLPGGRDGLSRPGQVPARPRSDAARPFCDRRARMVRHRPDDLAPDRAAPPRAAPELGTGALGLRPDVRQARTTLPRDRAPADPARRRHLDPPGARAGRLRAARRRRHG